MLATMRVAAHTHQRFDYELRELESLLLVLGTRARSQIMALISEFTVDDANVAEQIARIARMIEQEEREIDELGMMLLARRQPLAADLRFVFAAVKIATELRAIGHAAASASGVFAGYPRIVPYEVVEELGFALDRGLGSALEGLKSRTVLTLPSGGSFADALAALHAALEAIACDDDGSVRLATLPVFSLLEALEHIARHVDQVARMVAFAIEGSRS